MHLIFEGARRAPEGPGGPRRGPEGASAKPKDVGGGGPRGCQGALNVVLRPFLLSGSPGFFNNFGIILHFWARKGPPLYLDGKVTNPDGFVIGKPSISGGPPKPGIKENPKYLHLFLEKRGKTLRPSGGP